MSELHLQFYFSSLDPFFCRESYTPEEVSSLALFDSLVLKGLKEVGLFSLFNDFKEFASLSVFKHLQGLQQFEDIKNGSVHSFFPCFKLTKSVKESKELFGSEELLRGQWGWFEGLQEFEFLSYYPDFQLLICSSCSFAVNPLYLKGHLAKHFPHSKGKEKQALIKRAMDAVRKLTLPSLKESYFLLSLFSHLFSLHPLKELLVKGPLFSCSCSSACSVIKSSLYHIKRHIREDHKSLVGNTSPLDSFYKVVLKGQSLEDNRYFFKVVPLEEGKQRADNAESLALASSLPLLLEDGGSRMASEGDQSQGEMAGDSTPELFDQASTLFLESFQEKEEKFKACPSFSLSQQEHLSTFQIKTRYLEFLQNKDKQKLLKLLQPLSKEEQALGVVVDVLKEMLYLSLEKSLFLNKIHLNLLNSFQLNVTLNKGFKPLLNSNSRVKYFNFFSAFVIFLLRSFNTGSYRSLKLYSLDSKAISQLQSLESLAQAKLEEDQRLEANATPKNGLNGIRKSLSNKLNKLKAKNLELALEEESVTSLREEGSEEGWEGEEAEVVSISSCSEISLSQESSSSLISLSSMHSDVVLDKVSSLSKEDSETTKSLKSCLLAIIIALFQQETNLNLFASPIHSFFAAKGLRGDLSLRDTLEYSGFYSQFIYCSQLLVIDFSFHYIARRGNSKSLTSVIKYFMDSYFNNSVASPLGEILNHRSYCFKVNREQSSLSSIVISSTEKETISYKKVTLNVDNLRFLFKEAIQRAAEHLREELLLDMPLRTYKHITLEEFSTFEDLDHTTPYQCFKDLHPSSSQNDLLLRNYVLGSPSLKKKFFMMRDGNLVLCPRKVKAYFRVVKEFLKLGLLLAYLTSGLPMRGTELITLSFLNSNKAQREMFLDRASNLFILNISYFKGKDYMEKGGSNVRYLCGSVSKIFLLYIVLVYPFIDFLRIAAATSKSSYLSRLSLSSYLFCVDKSVLTSKDLSLKLNSFSSLMLGQKLNIQVYRQIIVGITTEFMQEALDPKTLVLEGPMRSSTSQKDIKALQMNHSLQTEELHYGRSIGTLRNTRDSIQKRYLEFCLRFFTFFKLGSTFGGFAAPFQGMLQERLDISRGDVQSKGEALALRFKKSSQTLGKHTRSKSSVSSLMVAGEPVKKIKVKDLNGISSFSGSTSTALTSLLREFLCDPSAMFRIKEQELLVKAILLKVPYILAVMPTNSGKSLGYLLTSALSTSKITVVIIPLVGLKQDILQRAKGFNIPCSNYERGRATTTLTLASIEAVVQEDFIFLLRMLIEEKRLDRIIVDECHLLISSKHYRPIMHRFIELLVVPVQVVFLTGTLPEAYEVELKETLKLESMSVIRASSSRREISYNSKAYASFEREEQILEVVSYINSFRSSMSSSSDKILIFCPTILSIGEFSVALNCTSYHSTLEGKEEVLNAFVNNGGYENSLLVSTIGLAEGLDYPSIRLVVFVDFTYSFLSFLQGSGRGGRDCSKSTSMFFYTRGAEKLNKDDSMDKAFMKTYLREQVCKRRIINSYLDNAVVDKCSTEEESCDLCLQRVQIFQSSISSIRSGNSLIERNRISFIKSLERYGDCCLYCLFRLKESDISHSTSQCSLSRGYPEAVDQCLEKVSLVYGSFATDSCCFTCLLPTVICARMKREVRPGIVSCFNPKLMYYFFVLLYRQQPALKSTKRLGIRGGGFVSESLLFNTFKKKVFLSSLDTEGIAGIQALMELLQEQEEE